MPYVNPWKEKRRIEEENRRAEALRLAERKILEDKRKKALEEKTKLESQLLKLESLKTEEQIRKAAETLRLEERRKADQKKQRELEEKNQRKAKQIGDVNTKYDAEIKALGAKPSGFNMVPYYYTNRYTGKRQLRGYRRGTRKSTKHWDRRKREINRQRGEELLEIEIQYSDIPINWIQSARRDARRRSGINVLALARRKWRAFEAKSAQKRRSSIKSAQSAAIKAREKYALKIRSDNIAKTKEMKEQLRATKTRVESELSKISKSLSDLTKSGDLTPPKRSAAGARILAGLPLVPKKEKTSESIKQEYADYIHGDHYGAHPQSSNPDYVHESQTIDTPQDRQPTMLKPESRKILGDYKRYRFGLDESARPVSSDGSPVVVPAPSRILMKKDHGSKYYDLYSDTKSRNAMNFLIGGISAAKQNLLVDGLTRTVSKNPLDSSQYSVISLSDGSRVVTTDFSETVYHSDGTYSFTKFPTSEEDGFVVTSNHEWYVDTPDGKRMFFKSRESADEFATSENILSADNIPQYVFDKQFVGVVDPEQYKINQMWNLNNYMLDTKPLMPSDADKMTNHYINENTKSISLSKETGYADPIKIPEFDAIRDFGVESALDAASSYAGFHGKIFGESETITEKKIEKIQASAPFESSAESVFFESVVESAKLNPADTFAALGGTHMIKPYIKPKRTSDDYVKEKLQTSDGARYLAGSFVASIAAAFLPVGKLKIPKMKSNSKIVDEIADITSRSDDVFGVEKTAKISVKNDKIVVKKLSKDHYSIHRGTADNPSEIPLTLVDLSKQGKTKNVRYPDDLKPDKIEVFGDVDDIHKTQLGLKQTSNRKLKQESKLTDKQFELLEKNTDFIKPVVDVDTYTTTVVKKLVDAYKGNRKFGKDKIPNKPKKETERIYETEMLGINYNSKSKFGSKNFEKLLKRMGLDPDPKPRTFKKPSAPFGDTDAPVAKGMMDDVIWGSDFAPRGSRGAAMIAARKESAKRAMDRLRDEFVVSANKEQRMDGLAKMFGVAVPKTKNMGFSETKQKQEGGPVMAMPESLLDAFDLGVKPKRKRRDAMNPDVAMGNDQFLDHIGDTKPDSDFKMVPDVVQYYVSKTKGGVKSKPDTVPMLGADIVTDQKAKPVISPAFDFMLSPKTGTKTKTAVMPSFYFVPPPVMPVVPTVPPVMPSPFFGLDELDEQKKKSKKTKKSKTLLRGWVVPDVPFVPFNAGEFYDGKTVEKSWKKADKKARSYKKKRKSKR